MEVTYADVTSVDCMGGRRHRPWCVGAHAPHRAAVRREGAGTQDLSIQNRRGTARHSEHADEAE